MPKQLPIISVNELRGLREGELLLIDVRENLERAKQQIEFVPQCHIPLDAIKYFDLRALAKTARNRALVCYCNSGRRSLIATLFLLTAGFTNVKSLAGGIQAWEN